MKILGDLLGGIANLFYIFLESSIKFIMDGIVFIFNYLMSFFSQFPAGVNILLGVMAIALIYIIFFKK